MVEKQRIEEYDSCLCLEIECINGELFICAESFDDDSLPEKVYSAIGKLLMLSGQEYLQFGYSQTASKLMVQSHGGGIFRLYNNGALLWPKISWPD